MPSKRRLPSKCKEWEKERRNKFNAALENLNILVTGEKKKLFEDNSPEIDVAERLSKIEIVQRAIEFVKFLVKCKEDINKELAYQKQLGKCNCSPKNKIVADTKKAVNPDNVVSKIEKKEKGRKNFKKVLKPIVKLRQNINDKSKKKAEKVLKPPNKIPGLLVKGNSKPLIISTVLMPQPVLLPATPFIQILPSIINSSFKKSAVAILPRISTNNITRTTMVNKVPIPSYSFISNKEKKLISSNNKSTKDKENKFTAEGGKPELSTKSNKNSNNTTKNKQSSNKSDVTFKRVNQNDSNIAQTKKVVEVIETENKEASKICEIKDSLLNKIQPGTIMDTKSNILPSETCDNTDGGNARLELAEELLASSPTAAFLMSFPLVSGVRAESPELQSEQNHIQRTEINDMNRNKTSNTVQKASETTDSSSKKPEQFFDPKFIDKQKGQINMKNNDKAFINSKISIPNVNSFDFNYPASTTAMSDMFLNFNQETNKLMNMHPNSTIYSKESTASKVTFTTSTTNNTSWPHSNNDIFSLYPCSVDRNPRVQQETDYKSFDDYLFKTAPFKLGYDLESAMTQKSLELPNLNTTKTNTNSMISVNFPIITTSSLTNNYNIYNTDFQLPLVSVNSSNNFISAGVNSNNFTYSQPTILGAEEPISHNHRESKNARNTKQITNVNNNGVSDMWYDSSKNRGSSTNYQTKSIVQDKCKRPNFDVAHLVMDKNSSNKKSPKKNHVNWMTSESKPVQNFEYDFRIDNKYSSKCNAPLSTEKQDFLDTSFLTAPIANMTSFNQDDSFQQIWTNNRLGDINMESCSINIPSLSVTEFALNTPDTRKNVNHSNQFNCYQSNNNIFSVPQLTAEKPSDAMPSWMLRSTSKSTKCKTSKDTNQIPEKQDYSLNTPLYPYCFDTDVKNFIFPQEYADVNHSQNVIPTQKPSKHSERQLQPSKQNSNYFTEALIRKEPNSNKSSNANKIPEIAKSIDDQNQVSRVSHYNIPDYNDNGFIQPFIYSSAASISTNNFYPNYISSSSNIMTNYTPSNFSSEFSDCIPTLDVNFSSTDNFKAKPLLEPLLFNKEYYDKSTIKIPAPDFNSHQKNKIDSKADNQKKSNSNKRQKLNNDVSYTEPYFYKTVNNYSNKDSNKVSQNQNSSFTNQDHGSINVSNTNRTNFHLSNLFPEITKLKQ